MAHFRDITLVRVKNDSIKTQQYAGNIKLVISEAIVIITSFATTISGK